MSSTTKRLASVLVASVLGIGVFAAAPGSAAAATDVMIVFDTTGSMGGPLTEAKDEIQEAMAQLSASLPDVQFGLAEVKDYNEVENSGPFSYGIGEGYAPWTLAVPITPNQSQVYEALLGLSAAGGGDGPEAYGRALYETDVNPAVGWRPGARGVIILVADNVPHDNDLNQGIPPELQSEFEPNPWNTGIDPGRDNIVGTEDDLDFQSTVLQQLKNDGRPIGVVNYVGSETGYLPYWEHWAGLTGGTALDGETGFLGEEIVALTKEVAERAPLSDCPAGQIHDAEEHCVAPPPTPTSTPPSPPPTPPSNHFKYEPRISCANGCHVVLVKITFDSDGNVIAESIPEEEGKASALISKRRHSRHGKHGKRGRHRKNRPPLIRKLHQQVHAGANALKLKLTKRALRILHRRHKLKLRLRVTFTPNGGTPKVSNHTVVVKLPRKKHHRHGKGKHKRRHR